VLLGRILFVVGLRKAFRDSGHESALLDFAVGAMAVSVAIEIPCVPLVEEQATMARTVIRADRPPRVAPRAVRGV